MPRGGTRCLGHLLKVFLLLFSVMETTYADSWLDMAYGRVGHEVKVSMTCIARSSDFALYLEEYLM